ncbi:hypothetical protein [Psychroflexus sp. MBR-150]|jgi:G:T/U-mismatch repair DNA glycosylase
MVRNFKEHPWIQKYPITKNHKHLIIGTHPPMPYRGCMSFFYGNMNQFWDILEKTYAQSLFFENGVPNINRIQSWLNKKQIGITDMLQYTVTDNKFSKDQDIVIKDFNQQYNQSLKEWLEQGNIETIFFTSFSEGKSAYALFKKWYKLNYNLSIRKGRDIIQNGNKEYIKINGKKIRTVMLYSPSPAARRGIPNSEPYREWINLKQNKGKSIDAFRIDWYTKYFKNIV